LPTQLDRVLPAHTMQIIMPVPKLQKPTPWLSQSSHLRVFLNRRQKASRECLCDKLEMSLVCPDDTCNDAAVRVGVFAGVGEVVRRAGVDAELVGLGVNDDVVELARWRVRAWRP
jgi:hypothetical protein